MASHVDFRAGVVVLSRHELLIYVYHLNVGLWIQGSARSPGLDVLAPAGTTHIADEVRDRRPDACRWIERGFLLRFRLILRARYILFRLDSMRRLQVAFLLLMDDDIMGPLSAGWELK